MAQLKDPIKSQLLALIGKHDAVVRVEALHERPALRFSNLPRNRCDPRGRPELLSAGERPRKSDFICRRSAQLPAKIADAARRAEQAGYESIWVSDHLLVPESGGRLPPIEILEPIATLAYVAAVTSRIKLATSVIVVPYRNAIHLAKELATLDRLSSGRVVAGVASGWLEAEFRALGVSFEKRGAYTDEAIKLMRAAWSSAIPEFHGEFFDLSGMRFGPRPAAGNIPIWVGGTSRRARSAAPSSSATDGMERG